MRSLFWLLTLAALAIAVALLGQVSEGYVLWVMPPWRAELSLNLFVVLQVLVLTLAYLLARAVVHTLNLPRAVAAYRARRAADRSGRTVADALRSFWEGRYAQAVRGAEAAADGTGEMPDAQGRASDTHAVAVLVGLKAAHALRDTRRIAVWRQRAEELGGGWRTARQMAEMRIALDERDFTAAHAIHEQFGGKERRQIAVQRLALRLAQGREDWGTMLRLARQLEKHKALTGDQSRPLRLRAHRGLLEGFRDDPARLMRYWETIPDEDRRDPPFALYAARMLALSGACAETSRLVEDVLDEHWDSDLLEPYALCEGGDLLGRIAHCEKWLHEHPDDAALLLALGRLCARRQLWGKAQSYQEASLAVAPSCAAHIELARLFDCLQRPDDANRHYRAAADCRGQDSSA